MLHFKFVPSNVDATPKKDIIKQILNRSNPLDINKPKKQIFTASVIPFLEQATSNKQSRNFGKIKITTWKKGHDQFVEIQSKELHYGGIVRTFTNTYKLLNKHIKNNNAVLTLIYWHE